MMINNVLFGKAEQKNADAYVYHNLSGNMLIAPDVPHWIGITHFIENIISHETLHKVIFKLEGSETSGSLDNFFSRSRKWFYQDNSGLCFSAYDLGEI